MSAFCEGELHRLKLAGVVGRHRRRPALVVVAEVDSGFGGERAFMDQFRGLADARIALSERNPSWPGLSRASTSSSLPQSRRGWPGLRPGMTVGLEIVSRSSRASIRGPRCRGYDRLGRPVRVSSLTRPLRGHPPDQVRGEALSRKGRGFRGGAVGDYSAASCAPVPPSRDAAAAGEDRFQELAGIAALDLDDRPRACRRRRSRRRRRRPRGRGR